MVPNLAGLTFAALLVAACPAFAGDVPAYLRTAVDSPLRPPQDHFRDPTQAPAELMAFAGVRPGQRIADFWPAPPYSTRLLSLATGPGGHVYGILPEHLIKKSATAQSSIAKDLAAFPNVTLLVQPFDRFQSPEALDLVWMGKIYHDFPNVAEMGPLDLEGVDRAVFRALKPGGVFIVVDHSAGPGSGYLDTESDNAKRRHRIDPAIVKAQVLAAGFEFVGESPLLANPADDHRRSVFDPAVRDHSDRFVFKFRKPLRAAR